MWARRAIRSPMRGGARRSSRTFPNSDRRMSEWWTYSLTSFLLFSARTYYRLFELINADVWPLQIVTLAAGTAILDLIVRRPAFGGRIVAAILAALWLFVAWAYLLERYDPINFAARYYAICFVLQA